MQETAALLSDPGAWAALATMAGTLGQIILLDAAFSLFAAVLVAVGAMMLAAGPLSRFLGDNPIVATLALGSC